MELAIERWEGHIPKNQTQLQLQVYPLIYVRPTDLLAFWNHVDAHSGALMATINETQSIYDDKQIPCIPQKVPVRPNFSAETGEIGILLWSIWYGYPPSLGTITI